MATHIPEVKWASKMKRREKKRWRRLWHRIEEEEEEEMNSTMTRCVCVSVCLRATHTRVCIGIYVCWKFYSEVPIIVKSIVYSPAGVHKGISMKELVFLSSSHHWSTVSKSPRSTTFASWPKKHHSILWRHYISLSLVVSSSAQPPPPQRASLMQ